MDPGVAPPTVGWASLPSITNEEKALQAFWQPDLMEAFFFSIEVPSSKMTGSGLCHANIKLDRTSTIDQRRI